MKLIKVCLLLLIFIAGVVTVWAQNTGSSGNNSSKKTTLLTPGQPTTRPNAPARVFISVYYDAEFIDFIFPDGVNEMTVRLTRDDDTYEGVVTIENVRMPLPPTGGTYNVTCVTDTGSTFYGTISI